MDKEWEHERFELVENQIKKRGIHDERVLEAFKAVPRHAFVPKEFIHQAYRDYPLGIGYGQTISQPYIVALMVAALKLTKSDCILEIGTGSGYQTAILSQLSDHVYTIERISFLLNEAKERLNQLGYTNISYGGWDGTMGWGEEAPFDAIIVSAAASHIPPALFQQLKVGGRLILPLGSRLFQRLTLFKKTEKDYHIETLCGCQFVPLISG